MHLIFFVCFVFKPPSEFDRSMNEDGYVDEQIYRKKKIAADVRVERTMHTCVICKQSMYFVWPAFRVSMIGAAKLYSAFCFGLNAHFYDGAMKHCIRDHRWIRWRCNILSFRHQVHAHQYINTIVDLLLRSFVCIWQTNINRNFLALLWLAIGN